MRWHSYLIAILSGLGVITATTVTWTILGTISSLFSIIVVLAVFQRKLWGAQLYGLLLFYDLYVNTITNTGAGNEIVLALNLIGFIITYMEFQYLKKHLKTRNPTPTK